MFEIKRWKNIKYANLKFLTNVLVRLLIRYKLINIQYVTLVYKVPILEVKNYSFINFKT